MMESSKLSLFLSVCHIHSIWYTVSRKKDEEYVHNKAKQSTIKPNMHN